MVCTKVRKRAELIQQSAASRLVQQGTKMRDVMRRLTGGAKHPAEFQSQEFARWSHEFHWPGRFRATRSFIETRFGYRSLPRSDGGPHRRGKETNQQNANSRPGGKSEIAESMRIGDAQQTSQHICDRITPQTSGWLQRRMPGPQCCGRDILQAVLHRVRRPDRDRPEPVRRPVPVAMVSLAYRLRGKAVR